MTASWKDLSDVFGSYPLSADPRSAGLLLAVGLGLGGCTLEEGIAPIADAGGDQVVAVGDVVVLDGSGSSDTDGTVSTYAWSTVSVPSGAQYDLEGLTDAELRLTVSDPGSYTFALLVEDNQGNQSTPDLVTVEAQADDELPVAILADVDSAATGQVLTLDGSDSYDPEDEPLSYHFELVMVPEGSNANLVTDAASPTASFVPDLDGFWIVGLVVDDGERASARVTVEFSSSFSTNQAPVVQSVVLEPDPVRTNDVLIATVDVTDADGDEVTLAYQWSVNGGVIDSLGSALDGSNFEKGDQVAVQVTPFDGEASGVAVTGGPVTVVNTPPTAPGLGWTPEPPSEDADLQCLVSEPSVDADLDSVTYAFQWFEDGAEYT
ncbi:MAG: PKD domain-containing protein, partial [Myxococcota bacterium]|nr:PKD domain-containing protein [Myxococcota bacterium]